MLKQFLTKFKNNGGAWEPGINRNGYPYDYHPATRHMRLGDGARPFPWPWQFGAYGTSMPMVNSVAVSGGVAKKPSGPNVNIEPVNLQYQVAIPGLSKVVE
jgi:hypothetical protein